MSHFRVDPDAQSDLDQIYDYVAKDSPAAADRLIRSFEEKLRLLATQPLMGQLRQELAPRLRSFSVGKYVFFYRPIQDGIAVARIIHGARDIETAFRDRPVD